MAANLAPLLHTVEGDGQRPGREALFPPAGSDWKLTANCNNATDNNDNKVAATAGSQSRTVSQVHFPPYFIEGV